MSEYYIVSRTQLIAAFAEWNRQYREHPERFEGDDEDGQASAEYLIELLSEQKCQYMDEPDGFKDDEPGQDLLGRIGTARNQSEKEKLKNGK